MSRRQRIRRSRDDLRRELIDQLGLLRLACQSYDSGFEASGKHIALSLRLLLHHHGQSRALLEQLGLRGNRFLDTAGPLNPCNMLSECSFIVMQAQVSAASQVEGRYFPAVTIGGPPTPVRWIPFVDWWNDPVLKDSAGRKFNRRELIGHVANTDGGAHVDPELDEAYMALSRANSFGWVIGNGNVVKAFEGRPELACMRQIAHETLTSLHEKAPEFREYAEPVIPADAPKAVRR